MRLYTTLLCSILLLSLSIPSFAGRVDEWPEGINLPTFKIKLASTSLPDDMIETWGNEWYEGKLFFIDTQGTNYDSVKILHIINISSNNTLVVFNYNGHNTYLPFNRIVKIYEVK